MSAGEMLHTGNFCAHRLLQKLEGTLVAGVNNGKDRLEASTLSSVETNLIL